MLFKIRPLAREPFQVLGDFISFCQTRKRLSVFSILLLCQPLFIVFEAYFHVSLPLGQNYLLTTFWTWLLLLVFQLILLLVLLMDRFSGVVELDFHVRIQSLVLKSLDALKILLIFFISIVGLIFDLLFDLRHFLFHLLFGIIGFVPQAFVLVIEVDRLNDYEIMPIDAIIICLHLLSFAYFLFVLLLLFLVLFPLVPLIALFEDLSFALRI